MYLLNMRQHGSHVGVVPEHISESRANSLETELGSEKEAQLCTSSKGHH